MLTRGRAVVEVEEVVEEVVVEEEIGEVEEEVAEGEVEDVGEKKRGYFQRAKMLN